MAGESGWLSGWQAELIDGARVARLATVARDGAPHLVPVCYARIANQVYVPVDEKPKSTRELARVRNLRREPRATILVDRYDDDWSRLVWVRLDCRGAVHEAGGAIPGALAALRERYLQYVSMDLESLPLLAFAIERVSSWKWDS